MFAADDVASRVDALHSKSGVDAVCAGPPLEVNLRRFIEGGALLPYQPQKLSLKGDGLLTKFGRFDR